MASYEKSGNGGKKYRVRWRKPGVRNPSSVTVPDLRTARKFCAEANTAEVEGRAWLPPARRVVEYGTFDLPLDELAVSWLAEKSRLRRDQTISAYSRHVERYLAFLGDAPTLAMFTRKSIQRFDGANKARGLSDATRRALVAPLRSWANWIEQEHPEFRAAQIRGVELPKQPKAKALVLEWSELDAVIDLMGGASRMAAMVARCTGLRRGEVVALEWDDFHGLDSIAPRLYIRDDITKGGRSGRTVPVAPVLARLLVAHRVDLEPAPSDRVCPIRSESFGVLLRRAFKKAVEAGVCRSDVLKVRSSAHLFRKAFVTQLRRKGADPDAVECLVGHDLGVRGAYVDAGPQMVEAVKLIPEFSPGGPPSKALDFAVRS